MKKVVKRVFALSLCMTLVFGMTACSNKKTSGEKETATEAKATEAPAVTREATATPVPTEAVPEEPKYDFGGRTVRIGSYYDMTPDPESSALKEALAERIDFVEQNYNCKIEFLDLGGDYLNQYITSVLAGDPVCDIGYVMTYKLLPSLIEGGIAYPISDLGVMDFDEYKWRSDCVEAGYYKGKNYGMLMKDPEIRYGIFWNKTLFAKYGLPDLYELYDKGEWTWDKFKEIAIAGNVDSNGDGEYDIYGFNERESFDWCYLYSNGANISKKTDDGIQIDLSDQKVIEALTALQSFKADVPHLSGWLGDWQSQIWSFRDGGSLMCLEEFWISYAYLNEMEDDWGFVPFPKGPSATDWSCYGKEFGTRFMLNGIDKPEEVAQIYDLITDIAETEEEWDELLEAQLEIWSDDAKTVEIVSDIYSRGLSIINPVKGFSTLESAINTMFGDVKNSTLTPQTAIETYKSQIDAAIADIANYDYDAEMQTYIIKEEETGDNGSK